MKPYSLLSLTTLLLAASLEASETVVFSDSFDAPDSQSLNARMEVRAGGELPSLQWQSFPDSSHNDFYSIEKGKLAYRGPGNGTVHPDKVFLVDARNGKRMNFGPLLGGRKYEIRFTASVLAKDGTDSVGFTVADRANGAGQGFIAVRQIQARRQVDLVANGKLSRLDKGFKATNEFRIVVDETGSKPVCEVFVNGWSAGSGAVEVTSAERYIFIQVVDNNRNGNALIDNFQLVVLE